MVRLSEDFGPGHPGWEEAMRSLDGNSGVVDLPGGRTYLTFDEEQDLKRQMRERAGEIL